MLRTSRTFIMRTYIRHVLRGVPLKTSAIGLVRGTDIDVFAETLVGSQCEIGYFRLNRRNKSSTINRQVVFKYSKRKRSVNVF